MSFGPRSPKTIRAAPNRRHPQRILVIDDYLPDVRLGAGFPRAVQLLQALASQDARVTLLPTKGDPDAAAVIRWLNPRVYVATGYGAAGIGRLLTERSGQFDLIIISRPDNMAAFREALPSRSDMLPPLRIVYDAEALFAEREILQASICGRPLSEEAARRRIEEEVALSHEASTILTVNEATAQIFRDHGHPDVRVLGYAASPQPTSARFEERDGFLFVGPTYADGTPNADAVVWFVDHVLPVVRREMARDVMLTLVGTSAAPSIADRADGRVAMLGTIPDLGDVFSCARVLVAPTRFASGVPLKVYDAAASGVPSVITPLLAEQLGWAHEAEVLVAATPADFAAQCLRLHRDGRLWARIRAGALARIARDCSPSRFRKLVSEIVSPTVGPSASPELSGLPRPVSASR